MDSEAYEIATDETFDEARYLGANPDVAAYVRRGGRAWQHFDDHGRAEGRLQFAPGAMLPRARKYERFHSVLAADLGAGGAFRFLAEEGRFPVAYGGPAHDLSEYEAESANAGFGDFNAEMESNPDRLYLEVGCGRRSWEYDNCLYLEVYPSVSADIVMEPACRYPIASESLDGIGCFAVLEHVPRPWEVAAEFRRMLKPGGKLFVDWPFLQPVHGFPSHYYNATRAGLETMFADGFEFLALGTLGNQTADHTLNWVLNSLVGSLEGQEVRAELLGMTVAELAAQAPGSDFWTRVTAAMSDAASMTLACGNTLVARKL